MSVTAEKQPDETTLAEDLDSALAEALQEVAEEQKEEPEEEVIEEVTEAKTEEEVEEAESEEETEEDPEETHLEAPEHWGAQDREVFAAIPKDGQEFLLRRHKDMEADYTRKTQDIAGIRKKADAFTEVFDPYRHDLAINGLDEVTAVRQLLAVRGDLQQDPKTTLLNLARQYGVDLSQPTEEEYVDPSVLALRQELDGFKQEQARKELEVQQQSQQTLLSQVETFRDAKDKDGNATHPHFEEMRIDMGRLIQSGIAADMNDAYTRVLSMRSDLQPVIPKAEPTKQERVKKAKKAATGVHSSGAATKSEALSLHDEISAQVNKAIG